MHRPWTEKRPLVLAALVALLAALPYMNSLGGDFTFDDYGVVRDNPMIQSSPRRLLTAVYYPGALYRPLTMLTYVANDRLWGSALGYHVVNVTLHVLASIAVFALARIMLQSWLAATAAGALFAVHPIHSEAVSGIVGRAELLSALCVLVALLAFVRATVTVGRSGALWYALSLAVFAAGLFAKESAFTALALVAVLHWWLLPRATIGRRIAVLLPFLLVGCLYLGLRVALIGSLALPEPPGVLDNPLAHVSAYSRLGTAIVILWQYLALLVLPVHLAADYSLDQVPVVTSVLDPRFLQAAAVLAALAVGLLWASRRAPELLLAGLFALVPLTLTANLLFPIGTIKAERLLYLPSFGWCLAFGWLAGVAVLARPRFWTTVLVIVVTAYGLRTWVRNRDWRDNFTLFTATVATSPNSAKAHYNAGTAYDRAGDHDAAMVHFRRALEIYPDYPDPAYGIGHIYERKQLIAGALHWYAKAVALDWSFAKAHLQTGLIRNRLGEYAAAEAALRAGLESDPRHPLLLVNLSAARLAQGDAWEALAILGELDGARSTDTEVSAIAASARMEIEAAARR